jgi:hypothetical protein
MTSASNQDTGDAKKTAEKEPVIINDRERPAHVLLACERFRELTGMGTNIVTLLAMPAAADIEFESGPAGAVYRAAELG